ncbi:MAG: hypothetical protein KDJ52_10240 [Anaerolineae bacterium]|nr:hypothetical protein [Anaerolineae bacterium]
MWSIIKKTGLDIWEEMLKLLVFNLVWVVGVILILPWPFVTFGLFFTAKDIGEGRGISFSSPFTYGLQVLRPAYIWGIINLVVYLGIFFNLIFYAGSEAVWANVMKIFILSLTLFWSILQLVMLAMYPRLTTPSFKLAIRNALIITSRHPLPIFAMVIGIIVIIAVSTFIPAIILLLSISAIVMLINNVIDVLVTYELKQEEIGRH